ncbi:hypothetical protein [Muribaculum intestinale]|uniref:hypothetical protein n=1 Tax=Muribaculum intestinale TaxID=1796646 RepID=UPI0025B770D0|nr:hypothetical protein [Muribaculum intestinale]
MKQPELKEIKAAYEVADENGKSMLRALYPDVFTQPEETDNRPVTERVKTFEDACAVLGEDHLYVQMFRDIYNKSEKAGANVDIDVVAYLKLRVVCAALNEGWEPQHTEDEARYYPWHWLYTQDEINDMDCDERNDRCMMSVGEYETQYSGFAYANSTSALSDSTALVGSRLCLKSHDLAIYCGKQFIDLWADFKLIRR